VSPILYAVRDDILGQIRIASRIVDLSPIPWDSDGLHSIHRIAARFASGVRRSRGYAADHTRPNELANRTGLVIWAARHEPE
jgi:hypothetical protein